ncbi:MAG TPA: hypothetical protein VHQ47_01625 [Phycisphaerae bacterium]|jgi:hypothetical protein|nr:hypothetical protein [Phycisphaerae bacterium]
MGIDYVDLVFQLEKRFEVRIGRGEGPDLSVEAFRELTAGDVHEWMVGLLKKRGREAPWSSWNRVRAAIGMVAGKSPMEIRRGTRLRGDLKFD